MTMTTTTTTTTTSTTATNGPATSANTTDPAAMNMMGTASIPLIIEPDASPPVDDPSESTEVITTTVNTPPGYFGNLTDAQTLAFDKFKEHVEQRFGPSSDDESSTAWYSDLTILRFLRARRFDVARAMDQFAAADAWRRKIDVDRLYSASTPAELQQSRRFYPRYTGRRDLHGRPVYVYRVGAMTPEQMRELFGMDEATRFDRIIALQELSIRFSFPLLSHVLVQEHPESSARLCNMAEATTILDLEGVSLSTLWTLRNHLKQASEMSTAYYPETMSKLAYVNVPGWWASVWSWSRKWFDEATQKKMFIVSAQQLKQGALRELVAGKDLPKMYGGEMEWTYEDEPKCDAATQAALRSSTLPEGPAEWRHGKLIIYDEEERKRFPTAVAPTPRTQSFERKAEPIINGHLNDDTTLVE